MIKGSLGNPLVLQTILMSISISRVISGSKIQRKMNSLSGCTQPENMTLSLGIPVDFFLMIRTVSKVYQLISMRSSKVYSEDHLSLSSYSTFITFERSKS